MGLRTRADSDPPRLRGMGPEAVAWLIVVALVMAALAACAEETTSPTAARGQQAFINECAQCHMQDGRGYDEVYPNLADNPIVTLHDPNPTIDIVLEGRGSMPPFKDELTVQELAAIVSYIRSAWGNDASTVTPSMMK